MWLFVCGRRSRGPPDGFPKCRAPGPARSSESDAYRCSRTVSPYFGAEQNPAGSTPAPALHNVIRSLSFFWENCAVHQ